MILLTNKHYKVLKDNIYELSCKISSLERRMKHYKLDHQGEPVNPLTAEDGSSYRSQIDNFETNKRIDQLMGYLKLSYNIVKPHTEIIPLREKELL